MEIVDELFKTSLSLFNNGKNLICYLQRMAVHFFKDTLDIKKIARCLQMTLFL